MSDEQCKGSDTGGSSSPPLPSSPALARLRRIGRWMLVLVAVVGSLIALIEWGITGRVSEEALTRFVEQFGVVAPLTFILIFTVLGSFFIPTTVFVVIGVTLFGEFGGFVYSVVGGFLALMVGFSAARTLGQKAISRWLGKTSSRLLKLDRALERRGISTSMFVRLLYIPNGVINATFGVSAIRAGHYAIGSLLGHIPIVFAVSFVAGGVREAILRRDWGALLGVDVLIGLAVFASCVSIPFLVGAIRRRLQRRGISPSTLQGLGDLLQASRNESAPADRTHQAKGETESDLH